MLSDPSTKTIETPPVSNPQIPTSSTPVASPAKTSLEKQLESEPDDLPLTSKPTSQTILTSTEEERASEMSEGRGTVEAEGEEVVKELGDEAGVSLGDRTKESEVVVEGMVGAAEESNKSGSGGEKSLGREETEVLSEEWIEIVGSGDKKNVAEESNKEEEVDQEIEDKEEEVEQEVEGEERDILVLDDEEMDAEEEPKEIIDQRSTRRRARTARKLAEIFATSEEEVKGGEDSETEGGEEEEVSLTRRSKSARLAAAGGTPVHGDKQDDPDQAEQEEIGTEETKAEEE